MELDSRIGLNRKEIIKRYIPSSRLHFFNGSFLFFFSKFKTGASSLVFFFVFFIKCDVEKVNNRFPFFFYYNKKSNIYFLIFLANDNF